MIREQAPAKINMSLHITGRREDGYHLMHMVNVSAKTLADTLTFEDAPALTLACADPNVPTGPDNLIVKTAELMQRICGVGAGAAIRLSKHIPMQAGLAGGSADAAAVIRGLDQLWHLSLSLDEMIQIAVKIGADVPYCLVNTPAVVTGIGEHIAPIASFPSFGVLGVKPPISVATPTAFAAMDRAQQHVPFDDHALLAAIASGDFGAMADECANDFEKVVFKKYPEVAAIGEKMRSAGAWMARMSGSGSTMIGYFKTAEAARQAAPAFATGQNIVFTAGI